MSRLQNLNEGIYFGNDMVQYTSLLETQQANPSATYEESTQMNLGADLGMFSNRLNATFDIWKDRRTGVYTIPSTFSSMLGYTTIYMPGKNIGKMETKGWEASLNWKDNIGKDFAYFLSGNISYSKNKVIDMDEALQPYDYMYSKGHPYGTSLVYIADGIFQSYEEIAAAPVHTLNSVVPGDIRYKDINGDGKMMKKIGYVTDTRTFLKCSMASVLEEAIKDFLCPYYSKGQLKYLKCYLHTQRLHSTITEICMNTKEIDGHRKTLLSTTQDLQLKLRGQATTVFRLPIGNGTPLI